MTPNEELKIEKKERSAVGVSVLIAIALGLIALVLIFVFVDDEMDPEFMGYLIGFVALVVSSYLIGRIYRKHLERKLGRRLKNEYELTSLTSWMEVSKKDKVQTFEKDGARKTD